MDLIKTGIKGLDNILKGGLPANRTYLVRGGPGSGKTTLGLQFLSNAENSKNLFISLGESVDKIKTDARKRGFNLDNIHFLELTPASDYFRNDEQYNIFNSEEIEKIPLINKILNKIKDLKPDRIFLDSITYFSYLSTDKFQFRKEILSVIKFAAEENVTFLLASESTKEKPDDDLQFVVDGVLNMNNKNDERCLRISKMRGTDYLSGNHSLKLKEDGMHVYPNFIPTAENKKIEKKKLGSGIPSLDKLLNGGIEKGTTTIISGPTGVGKTTLGVQYMKEAAGRGENSIIYTFEESPEIIIERSEGINIPMNDMLNNCSLEIEKINPLKYSPSEFLNKVRTKVEKREIDVVLIDSLAGYKLAFPDGSSDNEKVRQLHILTKYLSQIGVTVIIINEVPNIVGDFKATGFGVSYLADNIIILNYIEYRSQLKKTIGVLKKRLSGFESYLRELSIGEYGIEVGEPLTQLQGILTGNIVNTSSGDKSEK
jgi:circadian clock protein KaiC